MTATARTGDDRATGPVGPEQPDRPDRPGHWLATLTPFARPEGRPIAAVLGLLVVGAAVTAATPWPITLAVDSVLGDRPLPGWASWLDRLPGAGSATGLVVWLAAAVVVLHVVGQLLTLARTAIEITVGNRITYRIGGAVFERAQRMALTRHAGWPVGDLMARVQSDAGSGRDLVFRMMTPAAAAVVTVVTTSVVMISLQPVLWVVAVASAVPSALAGPLGNRPLTRLQTTNAEIEAARGTVVEEALSALPSVRVLGAEPVVEERYRELADELVGVRKRLALVEGLFGLGVDTLFGLSSAVFLLVGGWMVLDQQLTLGRLLVFLAYIGSLHAPLQTLVHLTTVWAATAARARRIGEVLGVDDNQPDTTAAHHQPPDPTNDPLTDLDTAPTITITDLTFAYPDNPPTLDNLNLTIPPGQITAITGPSGTGKSTLLTLITQLHTPQHGTIHINHHNTNNIHPTTLRNHIATVLQDPYIFPTTIAHNIALGHPDPTPTQIQQAAQAAGVTTFTDQLPQGLHTPIGERGTTLSGGQKQRIAIARALIRNTPILLLDEPTNALDTTAENHLLTTLKQQTNTTTLLITHKPTTLTHCHNTIHLPDHHTPTNHTIDLTDDPVADRLGRVTLTVAAPLPVLEVVQGGRVLYFDRDRVVEVGRQATADVSIADDRVDRFHLRATWTALGWTVEDLSAGGTHDGVGRRLGSTWLVVAEHPVHLGAPDGPELRLRALPDDGRIPAGPTLPLRWDPPVGIGGRGGDRGSRPTDRVTGGGATP
jgi:ATP-binding cassette subfamily B protein/subfamily B ATP-binding cassette protein MsbA